MRIVSITTYDLQCAISEPFGWSQAWTAMRALQLVRIDTDAGIQGWGECNAPGASDLIHTQLCPLLLGTNPLSRLTLWQDLFHALYNGGLQGGIGGSALSALDIALWDIAGKYLDQPVSLLLGGTLRSRIPVYATGLYYRRDELPIRLLDEAQRYVDAGFLGMKTKVGGLSRAADVARVAALRDTIGPDIYLMVDANQAFDAVAAIQWGQALQDLDLHWFEEPVHAGDLAAYHRVRQALPGMTLAGGEVLRTRHECAAYAASHAVDILQPDVVNVGGITEMQRVIALADALGVRVHPHVWGSPVMIAASLHLAATIPPAAPAHTTRPFVQEPVMEFDRTPNPLREKLVREPFIQQDGYITVPDGPGLGITLVDSVLEQYCVRRQVSDGNV